MRRSQIITLLVAAFSAALAVGQPSSDATTASATHRLRKSQPRAAPAPQPAVVPPAPAPSATVTYRGGLLTITARNATLREIMDRVRESTGAVVEAPALNERVTVQLGPEPPAAVISALLEGSHVNYVIVGGVKETDGISAIQITSEPVVGSDAVSLRAAAEAAAQAEAAAAQARTLFVNQTGGDEGVWDNEPAPSAVAAPAPASVPPAQPAGQRN